ncbi:MAG: homoserine dehydrogenase [Alphaproteobacteria bacterium]|nr:homoserine dehydrogenase [Alphaproteobacteria bacterium]
MTDTPPLRVAIAGLGTVGAGTARLLAERASDLEKKCGRALRLGAVSSRDRTKDRGVSLGGIAWHDDAMALARDPNVDVVVELIGGSDGIARTLVEAALANGKHVVTANKALIAHHGAALAALAESKGVALQFEAAVAGGIPIVKAFKEGLAANGIKRVVGILNGTCNYILDQMQQTRRSFGDVLKEAQEKGYAEADPAFDVDGIDTAHKLAILTSLAYGTKPDIASVYIEGIRHITFDDIEYAQELGYRIKLLGIARPTEHGIEQRVHPCMVAASQPLGQIPGVYNAIETEGDFVGNALFEGRGAGAGPTASAVVADLIDIARGHITSPFGVKAAALTAIAPAPIDRHQGAYYMRIQALDKPGVLASVSTVFFEEGVSIESCLQRGHNPGEPVHLAIITHVTRESSMAKALERIAKLANIMESPHMIRIEPL